jgi:hypothetical protein
MKPRYKTVSKHQARRAPFTCVTIHLGWMFASSATESFFTSSGMDPTTNITKSDKRNSYAFLIFFVAQQ